MASIRSIARITCLAVCFMLPGSAFAQVNTARVTGTATDPSGGVIPGATAKLENLNTNVTRTATSDSDGRFTFDFVASGVYRLTLSQAGFQTVQSERLDISAGQALDLPVHLPLAQVNQSVTVTSEEPLIATSTSQQLLTISQAEVNQLPVPHQDWTSLLQLGAGATKPTTAAGVAANSAQSSSLSINGLPSVGYNLTVDGTNATSNPEFTAFNFYDAPNIINTVNNDAIAEIDLVKGIAPATVGNTVSGGINIVTKSGSNHFHGGAYEINEEALYDARNQFLTKRPGRTFNEFGGSIGGPILRDKFFFFGSYEGARLSAAAPVSGTVPSPYLESIAPSVYAPLFALFPQVAQPAGQPVALTAQFSGPGATRQTDGNGVARLDYNFNANNLLAVRYIRARPNLLSPSFIPSNSQTTVGHTDAVNANYTHSGGLWTENTRFGFNQLLLNRVNAGFAIQLPLLTAVGFNTQGANEFLQHGNYITGEQGIAFVRRNHNVQFGGIVQRQNAGRYKLVTPSITYSTEAQFLANTPSQTAPQLYSLPPGTPPFDFQDFQFGAYIQDDWKIRSNLTLNLGLRYDHYTVPTEIQNRFFNRGIDPAAPQLGPGYGAYLPATAIYNSNYGDIQPRFGFAYLPNASQRTVVRGGFGQFYANHTLFQGPVSLIQPNATTPFNIGLNQQQTSAIGLKYPIDPTQYSAEVAALQALGLLSSDLPNTALNAHNPDPYSLQWQLGVEQVLAPSLSMEIAYVGTRGVNFDLYEKENLPDRITGAAVRPAFGQFFLFTTGDSSKYHALQATLTKQIKHGLQLNAQYTWSKDLTYGDADLLQNTFPVQDNNNVKADYGYSPYDIKNRFVANGFWTLPLMSLTHASGRPLRLLLDGWQISGIFSGQSGIPINITNSSSNYPADRPDRGPGPIYLKGYRSLNSAGHHQYLNPCQYTSAGNPNPSLYISQAASETCSVTEYNGEPGLASIAISQASGAQVRGGNFRRDEVRQPGYEDLDASLLKTFAITESVLFQLRMDTFNTLNHTNLGNPVSTINSSTFGELTTATARSVQIGGRLTF
jgi:Carboxypeptidase regulatory-like domain/TonB dependent receptor/TonB-dependent Receptor Plug Domain